MSKSNIINCIVEFNTPPVLSEEQKARLAALAALPDSEIDTSDAPFLPDAVWVKSVNVSSGKKLVSLRIDEEVLEFFRHTSEHYQTTINAVLRSYMNAHK